MDRNHIAYLHNDQRPPKGPSELASPAQSLIAVLPPAFCWTRIGAEAGQPLDFILRRKEWERRLNNGHFVWGIGNSVIGQMELLVRAATRPQVVFSRIRSPAQRADAHASRVYLWTAFRVAQHVYDLPPHVLVTSRAVTLSGDEKDRHYALFCHSSADLGPSPVGFNLSDVENFGTSSPVGFSQVTAIVKRRGVTDSAQQLKHEYAVDAIATLVYPFCATLEQPVELSGDDLSVLAKTISSGDLESWKSVVESFREDAERRRNARGGSPEQSRLL